MTPNPPNCITNVRSAIYRIVLYGCLTVALSGPGIGYADVVVLTTGERFTSSKVWKEGGKIRFNMHGLVVSVNPSEVATIIHANGTQQSHVPNNPQSQPVPDTRSKPLNPRVPLNPPQQEKVAKESPKPTIEKPASRPPAPKPQRAPNANPMQRGNSKDIGLDRVAWLMSPSQIAGLVKIKKDPAFGGIVQYYRPDETMRFGQALLDGKVYGFWRNRLYSIMMWAEGRVGYERLQKEVFRHYGRGRQNSKGLERYVWLDASTDRMLEFDVELNTGFLWMRSRKLDAQIKELYPDG